MRRVIAAGICVAACLFSGCDTEIQGAQEAVRKQLIDPDSAKFEGVHVIKSTGAVCGYVNAKNRMGGYVGQTPFFYTREAGAVLVKEMPSERDFERVFDSKWSTEDDKLELIYTCMNAHKWENTCNKKGFFPPNKYCPEKT